MVWVGVSAPSIGEFVPFRQRLRWTKRTGTKAVCWFNWLIYLLYGEKLSRVEGSRAHELPWASHLFKHFLTKSGVPFTWETKSAASAKRLTLWNPLNSFVICFCCLFWTWLCTTFNSLPIILKFLTNRNFALIYSVLICGQKTKDCARSGSFQYNLQHHCLQLWSLPGSLTGLPY